MARDFDGASDHLDCGAANSLETYSAGGGTFMEWIKADSDGEGNNGRIWQKSGSGNTTSQFSYTAAEVGGNIDFRFWAQFSTTQGNWHQDNGITIGNWEHWAVTYDSDSVANDPVMYRDGSSLTVSEIVTPVGSFTFNGELWVGDRPDDNRSFDGQIQSVVFWDTTLSSAEIAAMARGVNPFAIRYSNQVFNMTLHGNNDEVDNSGNGNTGVNTGSTKAATSPSMEPIENYL